MHHKFTSGRAACGRKTGVGSGAVGVEVVVEVRRLWSMGAHRLEMKGRGIRALREIEGQMSTSRLRRASDRPGSPWAAKDAQKGAAWPLRCP